MKLLHLDIEWQSVMSISSILMCVSLEHGKQCAIKTLQISFFGKIYNEKAVHSNPKKAEVIQMIPTTEGMMELQEFISIVTYMGSFVPKLSQNSEFTMESDHKPLEMIWLKNVTPVPL